MVLLGWFRFTRLPALPILHASSSIMALDTSGTGIVVTLENQIIYYTNYRSFFFCYTFCNNICDTWPPPPPPRPKKSRSCNSNANYYTISYIIIKRRTIIRYYNVFDSYNLKWIRCDSGGFARFLNRDDTYQGYVVKPCCTVVNDLHANNGWRRRYANVSNNGQTRL